MRRLGSLPCLLACTIIRPGASPSCYPRTRSATRRKRGGVDLRSVPARAINDNLHGHWPDAYPGTLTQCILRGSVEFARNVLGHWCPVYFGGACREANADAGLMSFWGVHDLNFGLPVCDAHGFKRPGVTHERGQDAVRAGHGVRAVEDLRANHRATQGRCRRSHAGLRRPRAASIVARADHHCATRPFAKTQPVP